MTGIVKPEIRNVLQIGWTAVRGILELAIMVYILRSMLEPADTVIVAVFGINLRDDPQHGARPTLHYHANGVGG